MENLVEQVNEKFLLVTLDWFLQKSPDLTGLGILMSAYLDFTHATKIIQDCKDQVREIGECE